jgi:hypothetical protein
VALVAIFGSFVVVRHKHGVPVGLIVPAARSLAAPFTGWSGFTGVGGGRFGCGCHPLGCSSSPSLGLVVGKVVLVLVVINGNCCRGRPLVVVLGSDFLGA